MQSISIGGSFLCILLISTYTHSAPQLFSQISQQLPFGDTLSFLPIGNGLTGNGGSGSLIPNTGTSQQQGLGFITDTLPLNTLNGIVYDFQSLPIPSIPVQNVPNVHEIPTAGITQGVNGVYQNVAATGPLNNKLGGLLAVVPSTNGLTDQYVPSLAQSVLQNPVETVGSSITPIYNGGLDSGNQGLSSGLGTLSSVVPINELLSGNDMLRDVVPQSGLLPRAKDC